MTPTFSKALLSQIIFDKTIYARPGGHDPNLVQRYASVLDEIEAAQRYIAVSPDFKLLDGKHRWLAYRKFHGEKDVEVPVLIYPVTTPQAQFRLGNKLNKDHGWQLTESDKEENAKRLFADGLSYDEIAADLSVSKVKVSAWLSRIVKDQKAKRNQTIFDMWMACYTQQEIANALNIGQQTVADFTGSVLENPSGKTSGSEDDGGGETGPTKYRKLGVSPAASHLIDFDVPLYNVWKQQEKTAGAQHFGNSDVRWVDNLLYLYTRPFDIVVDPFAGGGSTIDICRKRFRRYWASDRKPIVERADQIRQHDVTTGLPSVPRWQDVKLVYLDPPYWAQAAGQYSKDATDLANMPLDEFTKALAGIINAFAKKLSPGAVIALILQPTQWKAPEKQYTDHVADMIKAVKLPIFLRIQAPYESQQCTAQMVDWAKETRQILVISREIVVWRVAAD